MPSRHQSYKRIHTYDHESDIEKGKIKKEKAHARKARKKQSRLLNALLEDPAALEDVSFEAYEDALHIEKKEAKNARTHKQRLKVLTDDDAID